MDRNGFGPQCTGTLLPIFGGRKAFIPAPLPPPKVDISPIVGLFAKATQNIGELKGIGRTISNPMILVRPLQRREAVSSSGMEGTYTTLNDLLLLEAGAEAAGNRNETREVLNYARALETSIASLGKLPISSRMVRNAHRILLSDAAMHRGATIEPGEFKRHQNWIGGDGSIETARFIPAPPDETADAIDALMGFINRTGRENASPLLDAAFAHYQFEAIHPFADGNGRVGRMLIALMLAEYEVLPQPLLYLSPWLERNKDRYIDTMFAVSKSGDWLGWLAFFLTAVAESSSETIRLVERLLALQVDYRARFQTARRSALMLTIIDLAFERPVLRVTDIAERLGVSYQGATNNVKILLREGVAVEVAGAQLKTIRFPEIIDTLRLG